MVFFFVPPLLRSKVLFACENVKGVYYANDNGANFLNIRKTFAFRAFVPYVEIKSRQV